MNENIAYLVGVLHTDGYIYKDYEYFEVRSGIKSLQMLEKIQKIIKSEFRRDAKIHNYGNNYVIQIRTKKLKNLFHKFQIDKHKLPSWIRNNEKFFCAYLAGVIDGDGDVSIKRPKYPQCEIRITSGEKLLSLIKLIKRYLNCSAYIQKISYFVTLPNGRRVIPNAFRHRFYVSLKNGNKLISLVYPYIQISHKRERINDFYSKFLKNKLTSEIYQSS